MSINVFVITDNEEMVTRVDAVKPLGYKNDTTLVVINNKAEWVPAVKVDMCAWEDGFHAIFCDDVFQQIEKYTSRRCDYDETWLGGEYAYLIIMNDQDRADMISAALNLTSSLVYRMYRSGHVGHSISQFTDFDSEYGKRAKRMIADFLAGTEHELDY